MRVQSLQQQERCLRTRRHGRLAPRERTSPEHPPICHGCLPINELHDCIPTISKRSRIGLTAWIARTTMGQGFFGEGVPHGDAQR